MRSTPGCGDPKAPLPPEERVATPTATFEFPFVWITWRVPESDWLVSGSDEGAGQVTEIGTSRPSEARVAGEPTETAKPESADAAAGRSPSSRTGVSAPNRRSRLNIIGHLMKLWPERRRCSEEDRLEASLVRVSKLVSNCATSCDYSRARCKELWRSVYCFVSASHRTGGRALFVRCRGLFELCGDGDP